MLLVAVAAAVPGTAAEPAAVPAAPAAPGIAPVPAAAALPGGQPTAAQVTQYLDQTVAWYRGLVVQQEIATDTADLALVADNRAVTDQIVRLAFQFARSAASLLGRQGGADQSQPGPAGQYQSLMQLQARLDKQAQDMQAGLEADRAKLATSGGKGRQTLQSQIAQLEGQLQLVNARRDAVHTMLEFVTGSTANGLGGSGLRAQIEALAASIGPVAKATPPPLADCADRHGGRRRQTRTEQRLGFHRARIGAVRQGRQDPAAHQAGGCIAPGLEDRARSAGQSAAHLF